MIRYQLRQCTFQEGRRQSERRPHRSYQQNTPDRLRWKNTGLGGTSNLHFHSMMLAEEMAEEMAEEEAKKEALTLHQ